MVRKFYALAGVLSAFLALPLGKDHGFYGYSCLPILSGVSCAMKAGATGKISICKR